MNDVQSRNYTIPSDNRELQQLCNATGYAVHYTIPSDNRELQRNYPCIDIYRYYTIPSDNRELQRQNVPEIARQDYTIPSDNRELQLLRALEEHLKIIPYQVITGNYNLCGKALYRH